jgi:hypothetical protein
MLQKKDKKKKKEILSDERNVYKMKKIEKLLNK